MDKEQPYRKWNSDETNLFCEILADTVNNFIELKKSFTRKLFNSITRK